MGAEPASLRNLKPDLVTEEINIFTLMFDLKSQGRPKT
jgi:hypothetical protein